MGWLVDVFGGPFFIGAGVGMNHAPTPRSGADLYRGPFSRAG